MESLKNSILKFRAEVSAACERAGRDPDCVKIVPATKTRDDKTVNSLLDYGIDTVGENRVQEFLEKYPNCDGRIKWHFIGQLQTNKVKYIIDKAACIESLDREDLAAEIEKQASKRGIVMPCYVEINAARNPLHGGVDPSEAERFVETIQDKYPHIRLRGIMAVLPHEDIRSTRAAAEEMGKLSQTLAKRYAGMVECSMGMSEDYITATECGATELRPGRALFGIREQR